MLVSIIIPIYNRENFIAQCLDSIVFSNLADYEIILVDDNSNDKSIEICEKYVERYKCISLYRLSENVGPGMAREFGIKCANGEFIYCVDSDDTLVTTKLAILFEILKNNRNTDIFCFNHNLLYENGTSKTVNTFKTLGNLDTDSFFYKYPHCLTLTLCSCIFNREFISKNNIVNYRCSFLEDAMFACQAFLNAKNIYTINEAFYNYRYYSSNSLMKSLEYEGRLNGIITFSKNLISYKNLINSNPKQVAYDYAFYSLGMRLLLLSIESNKLSTKDTRGFKIDLNFEEIFTDFDDKQIPSMIFGYIYEKIRAYSLNFSKKIYFAPAGIFSLAIAKELGKRDVKIAGFLDNNSKNSPYANRAVNDGFLVLPIENTNLDSSILVITHTTLATVELSSQFEKRGLIKDKDFICFI